MKEQDAYDPIAAGYKRVTDAHEALKGFRASIDNIDAALIHMLAERFRCTQAVGVLKATHGLPPADPAREQQQIARLRQLAQDAQLDPDFAEKFLNFVIKEVIRHHEQIAAGNGATAPGAEGASTNR
jgi:chorismate mutase